MVLKESLLESIKEIEQQTRYLNKIVAHVQDYSRTLTPFSEEINIRELIEPPL